MITAKLTNDKNLNAKLNADINILTQMDRVSNFLEFGVLHTSVEKFSRFMIAINPFKKRDEKAEFIARSNNNLEQLRAVSRKSNGERRKKLADDFAASLKEIFQGCASDSDLDKLFSVEKVKRQNITKFYTLEDCFVNQVVINLPNFYAINRAKNYDADSMSIFTERFLELVEALQGKKMTAEEKSRTSKSYVIAAVEDLDDKVTTEKFERMIADITARQNDIGFSMVETFYYLYNPKLQAPMVDYSAESQTVYA